MKKPRIESLSTPKMKRQFHASLQAGGTLELLVYEEIGMDYWTGEGVTAKAVKQQLDSAGIYNRIAVRINSPGGDAFEGVAILNLLKAQKKPIEVAIDGIAASAASIIAMAGDTITMGPSAMMMIHNAWTICMGDGDDMRQCANTLDKISLSVGQAYVDRTGKSAADIKKLMDAETWMGADECVAAGFATSVAIEPDDEQAMALAKSFKSLAKLKHVPDALRPKNDDDGSQGDGMECRCNCASCIAGNCEDCSVENCMAENCDHGDVQNSNLSQYEARLELLEKV